MRSPVGVVWTAARMSRPLARSTAGLTDGTISSDVTHLEQMREWFGRPLWDMAPADADVYFGKVLRYAAKGTRLASRIGALTSNPTRKSSPASCTAAKPTSNSPPVYPRLRTLVGPIAASNNLITPSRSTNSLTAAIPDTDRHLDYPGEAVTPVTNTERRVRIRPNSGKSRTCPVSAPSSNTVAPTSRNLQNIATGCIHLTAVAALVSTDSARLLLNDSQFFCEQYHRQKQVGPKQCRRNILGPSGLSTLKKLKLSTRCWKSFSRRLWLRSSRLDCCKEGALTATIT